MDHWAAWKVGPDGALWTDKGLTLHTFRDDPWKQTRLPRSVGAIVDFDVVADGTVWVAGLTSLHRLDPDGSLTPVEGSAEVLGHDLELDRIEVVTTVSYGSPAASKFPKHRRRAVPSRGARCDSAATSGCSFKTQKASPGRDRSSRLRHCVRG